MLRHGRSWLTPKMRTPLPFTKSTDLWKFLPHQVVSSCRRRQSLRCPEDDIETAREQQCHDDAYGRAAVHADDDDHDAHASCRWSVEWPHFCILNIPCRIASFSSSG